MTFFNPPPTGDPTPALRDVKRVGRLQWWIGTDVWEDRCEECKANYADSREDADDRLLRHLEADHDGPIFRIVRYFCNSKRNYTIKTGLTEVEAQAYCNDPETNSSTAVKSEGRRRTRRSGPWFDSYTQH